jgi:hypothetical protein
MGEKPTYEVRRQGGYNRGMSRWLPAILLFACAGGSEGSNGGDAAANPDGGGGGDAARADGGGGPRWMPAPRTTWQWQLTGAIDTSFDVVMYDVDLFETPQGTIDELHGDGRVVICYFSAGSHENWRPDEAEFPAGAVGNELDGWPDEHWLDVRDATVRRIMGDRLDLAVERGCDGVEPDNVDGYANNSGFPLAGADQLDYNAFLAAEAHARGLSVGLKNDVDQIGDLVDDFDWALNEECHAYDECNTVAPFIDAGKAVFHVEYGNAGLADTVCPDTVPLGLSTLIKNLDLDAWRVECP